MSLTKDFAFEYIKTKSMVDHFKLSNECMKMADIYRSRGYDVEAEMMEKYAEEVRKRIEKY